LISRDRQAAALRGSANVDPVKQAYANRVTRRIRRREGAVRADINADAHPRPVVTGGARACSQRGAIRCSRWTEIGRRGMLGRWLRSSLWSADTVRTSRTYETGHQVPAV